MSESHSPGQSSGTRTQVIWIVFLSLATYAFGLSVRLMEVPLWFEGEAYKVGDAFLLATADAYYWLAGAEGLISTARSGRTAIPEIVDFLARTTDISHNLIAFWLPVILAPLVAIPACVLAVRWRLPEGALIAGLLAAAAPGYLFRTRLGFLDDDMLLVLFPCVLVAGIVVWLDVLCRKAWLATGQRNAGNGSEHLPSGRIFWGALLLGGWTRVALWYYPKGTVLILSICLIAFVLALVLAKPGYRIGLLLGFFLLFATAIAEGVLFWAVAFLTMWALFFRGRKNFSPAFLAWASLPAALLVSHLSLYIWSIWEKNFKWLSRTLDRRSNFSGFDPGSLVKAIFGQQPGTETPLTIQQQLLGNVSELQLLSPWETMNLLAGHPVFFILGLVGIIYLIWKRPLALLLLPLVGIALIAFQLGARYTVFSAIASGLGASCGLALLLRKYLHSSWMRWVIMMLISIACGWLIWPSTEQVKPTPAIHRETALALRELDKIAAKNAMIWIHWDLAYAAQYYSRRKAYAAIGSAKQLLRIAPPLATDNPGAIKKMIRKRIKKKEVYLVVDFFTLRHAESVLKAGTWNSKKKKSAKQGLSKMMDGAFPINIALGILGDPDLQTIELKSLDVLAKGDNIRYEWFRSDGNHLILNQEANRAMLMDQTVYDTMATQLQVQNPSSFQPFLQIAVDDSPWVRIFRVAK